MEDIPKIYEDLYDASDAEKLRHKLIAFIKSEAKSFTSLSDSTYAAAYSLAGLMATDYVRGLSDDDPIVEILSLAGELEVAPPNSQELAAELVRRIQSLS